ncbi:MAG TPA: inorganic diphosphatase [Candidatus Acidoferrum sp.]|nr:inorganic diphosphatase [Candidatus Acidoferrum sp.]
MIAKGRIEMVSGSNLAYAYHEETGKSEVRRELARALPEPFNYGYVPGTICQDGEELDIFILSSRKFHIGDIVEARPIGVILMEDEGGVDNKIIAVDAAENAYSRVTQAGEVRALVDLITYYVQHNKDGIPGKFVNIKGLGDAGDAEMVLKGAAKNKRTL